MITVGAAIADSQRVQETAEVLSIENSIKQMDEKNQLSIGVPPLTLKEKNHT